MSITNRNLHPSQQFDWITYVSPQVVGNSVAILTGASILIDVMPYQGTIVSGLVAATGVSSAMQVKLGLHRFVPGSGLTLINVSLSGMVLQNLGTSGALGFSGLPAQGSTLLNFLAGDVVYLQTSVSNGAATSLVMELVVKKTQDIVSYSGVIL